MNLFFEFLSENKTINCPLLCGGAVYLSGVA